jgi:hypothetical protein
MGWLSSVGCDTFRGETYGDVKTSEITYGDVSSLYRRCVQIRAKKNENTICTVLDRLNEVTEATLLDRLEAEALQRSGNQRGGDAIDFWTD